ISNVNWPQGQASATVRLDGAAPMALQATLQAQLLAPLPGTADAERPLAAHVRAEVRGTLAGPDARLALSAKLRAAPPLPAAPAAASAASSAAPPAAPPAQALAEMRADLSAQVAPWQPQPLLAAD